MIFTYERCPSHDSVDAVTNSLNVIIYPLSPISGSQGWLQDCNNQKGQYHDYRHILFSFWLSLTVSSRKRF